uniref:Secreted protein n=1 Tax=Panagrellus redivivus TaxID=6233 RepID=A0A7E4VRH9_PANRE
MFRRQLFFVLLIAAIFSMSAIADAFPPPRAPQRPQGPGLPRVNPVRTPIPAARMNRPIVPQVYNQGRAPGAPGPNAPRFLRHTGFQGHQQFKQHFTGMKAIRGQWMRRRF